MKKKLILFISIFLLLILNVNAKINNNYNVSADYANKYIDMFEDNSKYIIRSNGSFIVPFSYENGTLSTNNLYKNGGMLSLTEFKNTLVNNDSYLLSGQEYWTLTSKNNNYNYVITHIKENYKDISSDSGLKVTEQIKEDTKVYGDGTYNNPWIFVPKYNIIVKNTTPDYGNVSTKSKYVYAGDSAKITLEPKPGYGYDSDTCSNMSGYSRDENNVIISNVRKDITCSFAFASKIFNVEFDSNGGSICNPSSYSYQKGDTYNLDCTPIRNGFNFDGWYSVLDGNNKLTSTTKITNYDDHSIYAHWLAKSITLNNQNFEAYYSSDQIGFNIVGATGGSGVYTYTIAGNDADNFSISANTLNVEAGTNVGTYTLTVTAIDDYSESTTTAVFTVTIKQQTTTTKRTTTSNRVTTIRTTTPTTRTTTRTTTRGGVTVTTRKSTTTTRTTTKGGVTNTRTTTTTTRTTTKKTTTATKPVTCTSIRSSSVCESTPGCIWRQQACYVNDNVPTTAHTTTTTKKPTSCTSIKNSSDCTGTSGCIWRQGACYVGGSTTTTKKVTTTTKKVTTTTKKVTTTTKKATTTTKKATTTTKKATTTTKKATTTTKKVTTTTKKPSSCGSIKNSGECKDSGCIWRQGACYVGGSTTTTKKVTTTTKKATTTTKKPTTKATTKKTTTKTTTKKTTTKATTKKTTTKKTTTKATTKKTTTKKTTTKKTTKRTTTKKKAAARTMSLASQCTCVSGSNCFGGYVCTGNSCCSQ